MLTASPTNQQTDLTSYQLKILKQLIEAYTHER